MKRDIVTTGRVQRRICSALLWVVFGAIASWSLLLDPYQARADNTPCPTVPSCPSPTTTTPPLTIIVLPPTTTITIPPHRTTTTIASPASTIGPRTKPGSGSSTGASGGNGGTGLAGAPGSHLSFTGINALLVVAVALGMIGAGWVIVTFSRRSKTTQAQPHPAIPIGGAHSRRRPNSRIRARQRRRRL